MYIVFVLSLLAELLLILRTPNSTTSKSVLVGFTIILVGFSSSSLLVVQPGLATVLFSMLSFGRLINPLRYAEGRLHPDELRRRAFRTFKILGVSSLFLFLYMVLADKDFSFSIYAYISVQIALTLSLTLSVLVARTIYRYRSEKKLTSALPTVTVCVPARNETADLPGCIESILANTYPKLEIIVLDDCSHDKTPEIIKKYAHDGVRFINGKEPREDWLAKNAAYDRLADEARGDLLLFVGVDVRMEPNTINELVAQIDGDEMLSVLPKRAKDAEAAFFIQPIRYWWELGLWRFVVKHPPVLSTCWMIRRKTLERLGTFESVKKAIEPEAIFARKLLKEKKYAFLVANDTVGLTSKKSPKDQYLTALRKRYSQVHRRPESALMVMALELLTLVVPWLVGVYAIANDLPVILALSLVSIVLASLANAEVYKLALKRLWPLGLVSAPLLALTDVILMTRSLYAYEFGKVIWKERNICLPLLTVEKSLPKL